MKTIPAIFCRNCETLIVSFYHHHYKECECKECFIDAMGARIGYTSKDTFKSMKIHIVTEEEGHE